MYNQIEKILQKESDDITEMGYTRINSMGDWVEKKQKIIDAD